MSPADSPLPVGVLLAQLGTPSAPTARALRPYLRQFLADPRVVDVPPLKWWPILHLFVLTRRPARSAALYRRVWQPEGSPLLLHSQAVARGLQAQLGSPYRVALGMRYGEPSLDQAVAALVRDGCTRILVLPMFPQFSCSTSGSIYDGATQAANGRRCPWFFSHRRWMPTLRFAPPYFDDPGYLEALAVALRGHLGDQPVDHYLFSFHGLPQRYADEGDPYPQHCQATARGLAAGLHLSTAQWSLAYQSRFGREAWLQPYTDVRFVQLAQQGVRHLAVACPGFTADCLETLDEIGHEGERLFTAAGGSSLRLVPCLNDHPVWLRALVDIAHRETAGWV